MPLRLSTNPDKLYRVDGNHPRFEDSPAKGGDWWVMLRPLSRTRRSELMKAHSTFNPKTREPDLDTDAFTEAVFTDCIADWGNVVGDDGEPLPCTEEIKRAILEGARGFADKIGLITLDLGYEQVATQEALVGNSETSGSGS